MSAHDDFAAGLGASIAIPGDAMPAALWSARQAAIRAEADLAAARARVAELTEAIKKAPHDMTCAAAAHEAPCNCWRSGALAGGAQTEAPAEGEEG